jgi:transposase-like protein
MSKPTFQEILPADIVFNAGTQARIQTDQKTIQAYIESMQDGIEFPPVDVFCDEQSDQCILADGFHRYTAHLSIKPNEPIRCTVHNGNVEDARIFACGANATHGLRRTNEDKRKAVKLVLQEQKCQEWSDRRIAEHVGVNKSTVARIRHELELSNKKHRSARRIGKDGRVIETKNIGYSFDEEPEPESCYRTNADGKTVNVHSFDFKSHRNCEDCIKWDTNNGFCLRDEKRQPSWTPACSDFENRNLYSHADEKIQTEVISTRPKFIAKNPHGEHALHVREKSVKCKLYPSNPQLSACEIRTELGEEFLFALQKAIDAITQ